MINPYYQQELTYLKELAVEFSKAHPALAPMLSGPTSDPDVERLLEGTAFLTGMVREKLDDQFPELLHSLLQLIMPHYLRPIPSATIIQFMPKPGLMEILPVKSGVAVASIPVDGTPCMFTTSYEVEVHPLQVANVNMERLPGLPPVLRLGMNLTGPSLEKWSPTRLRFLVGGSYEAAADRFHTIFHHTRQIRITPVGGGSPVILPRECLQPVGMRDEEALLPYPTNSFPGFRLLQEYFILPHKFLFFDIVGWDRWQDRGKGSQFEIAFEFSNFTKEPREFNKGHFILGATPASNVFPHAAEPILLDHKRTEYRIRPADQHAGNYQVYSVQKVTGFLKGTVRQREYVPFEMFRPTSDETAVYHLSPRLSAIGENAETYLAVAYPPEAGPPQAETLSIELLCTNAQLPEKLQLGDISQPTETSPSLLSFKNIHPPTAAVQPPLGKNLLWRLLSQISLNFLSIADTDAIKALLRLYIFPDTRNKAAVVANTKRVDGIVSLSDEMADRLVKGVLMRGRKVTLVVDSANFASLGDMYVFGSILDLFLASYASLNSFTFFTLEDKHTGESYRWPLRIGDRHLL
jgi:type VI secretion system protein ImpG